MYSLLVGPSFSEASDENFGIPKDRFLEYTGSDIKNQLLNLSIESQECIMSWPCLLMPEGIGQEHVSIAQIKSIRSSQSKIEIVAAELQCSSEIYNNSLWKIREKLDIEQFEFSRNHWAIKERNLFSILREQGYNFDKTTEALFTNKPLPMPTRANLFLTRDIISEWSHTQVDDLLLEAGLENLDAGRGIGSRRDRANRIIEFVLNNPAALTAENSLFSSFLIKKTEKGIKKPVQILTQQETKLSPIEVLNTRNPNRVFIVHGNNDEARKSVASFVASLGLEGIVLHEQPNMGRHLLTKFIDEAELVTFAIILMTDDDIGSLKGGNPRPRARQNVILELGYFLARLGQKKVCALITPGLETPSDFDGIVYIKMSSDENWKRELERELKAANMPIVVKAEVEDWSWLA